MSTPVSSDLESAKPTPSLEQEAQPLLPRRTTTEEEEQQEEEKAILQDAKDTIVLGIPIFLAMLSWVGMVRSTYKETAL